MNFLYHGALKTNGWLPSLDADLKIRTAEPDKEQLKQHQLEYAAMVSGQVQELLTNYGKIDLLWFDGKPPIPEASEVITAEEIRKLQPGIVINPRLHGKGDFLTYERKLNTDKVTQGWAEYCNTWNSNWSYTRTPYKSDGYVLGQLAKCRSLGINYLLGIGPMASGALAPEAYQHMAAVAQWMKANGVSIHGAKPLPPNESANVPATAVGSKRFLFAIPRFSNGMSEDDQAAPADTTLTIKGAGSAVAAALLGDGSALNFKTRAGGVVAVDLPAAKRTKLVDVVQVEIAPATAAGSSSP
jgi:alpha-L-fucosidase